MIDEQKRGRTQERRAGDPVMHALAIMQKSFDVRHAENVRNILEIKTKVDRVLGGFPNGDPEGHCQAHQAMIDEALERKKLYIEIRNHILKGGAWAVCIGIAWGAWVLLETSLLKR